MPKLEGLTVRQVDLDRLDHLRPLMAATLGHQVDQAYFDWKYRQNPNGQMVGFEAITEDGTAAAFYGLLPERYRVNGQQVRVWQSMDTMTHPDYQRRGLFTHLAELSYQHVLDSEGQLALIGIAGPSSLPGFVGRLGWQQPRAFRYWFTTRSLLPRGQDSYDIEPITDVRGLADYLDRVPSESPVSVDVDAPFLEWRVLNHRLLRQHVLVARDAGIAIALCAYTVVESGRALLTMLSAVDAGSFAAAIPRLLRGVANATGARWLYTWEPGPAERRQQLRRMRFLSNPVARGPFSYRVPLITWSDSPVVGGVRWDDPTVFDLQPFMQD